MDVLVAEVAGAAALSLTLAAVARWRAAGRLVHMLRDEGYQSLPQEEQGPSSGVQSG